MKKNDEFKDVYEDVVIENYGIPVVITDVLVRKHKTTGRNIYINHLDSIHKIEKGLKAALGVAPRGQTSYKRKLSYTCPDYSYRAEKSYCRVRVISEFLRLK